MSIHKSVEKFQGAERISRARLLMMIYFRFYGVLLSSLEDRIDNSQPTAATDGKSIIWSEDFIAKLDDEELVFVLAHEVLHCALLHHLRRGTRDPLLWNMAADYRINHDLVKARIGRMPSKGLFDPKYDEKWSADDIYDDLAGQQKEPDKGGEQGDGVKGQNDENSQSGSGSGGNADEGQDDKDGQDGASEEPQDGQEDGSEGGATGEGSKAAGDASEGSGGNGSENGQEGQGEGQGQGSIPDNIDEGGCGGVIDGGDDACERAAEEDRWQKITRQAVAVAARAGTMDGNMERIIAGLSVPSLDWRTLLQQFVSESQATDYSWMTPDNRFPGAPFILPGLEPDGVGHIAVILDTSGSMSDELLGKLNVEIQSMMDGGQVDHVTVVHCDTKIGKVSEYEAGDMIEMDAANRGGTTYQPAWEWLAEQTERPACVIYMTDLEPARGFGDEPDVPVLWIAGTSYPGDRDRLRSRIARVPFGTAIEIN